jgi:hypothetical protein
MRIVGRITKWVGERGWGVANSYSRSANAPERFFVHISNVVNADIQLTVGTRITFEAGPPRQAGEMPVALMIELAPPPRYQQNAPVAPDVLADPLPVKKNDDGKGGAQ